MSAQRLRDAAEKLRGLAQEVFVRVGWECWYGSEDAYDALRGWGTPRGEAAADAAFIAAMSPKVALVMADLLDALATRAEDVADTIGSPGVAASVATSTITGYPQALAVADAILGAES